MHRFVIVVKEYERNVFIIIAYCILSVLGEITFPSHPRIPSLTLNV